MTFTSSQLRGLWRILPGNSTVTYKSLTANNTFSSSTVKGARFRPVTKEDMDASQGRVSTSMRACHLWTENLVAVVPKEGDQIVDAASVTWTVQYVPEGEGLIGNRYKVFVLRNVS